MSICGSVREAEPGGDLEPGVSSAGAGLPRGVWNLRAGAKPPATGAAPSLRTLGPAHRLSAGCIRPSLNLGWAPLPEFLIRDFNYGVNIMLYSLSYSHMHFMTMTSNYKLSPICSPPPPLRIPSTFALVSELWLFSTLLTK